MKHGKKYLAAYKQIDKTKQYSFAEAAELVKKVAFAKFDETVELSLNLSLKKSQSVRDTVVLPHQFSAEKRILVFAKGEKAQEALDAGATFVGDNDLIEKIKVTKAIDANAVTFPQSSFEMSALTLCFVFYFLCHGALLFSRIPTIRLL